MKLFLAAICVVAAALAPQVLGKTILFKNGIIHQVSGPALTNGFVLIEGRTIKQVGSGAAPGADEQVDLKGVHLFPGMISPGTTLGLIEIAAVKATRDFQESGEYTPEVRSWEAINPDSDLIAPARNNGITHILPVPMGGVVTGFSGLVQLTGWTSEEMLVKGPIALHVFWPSMDLDTRAREELPESEREKHTSLEEQAKARRAKLKEIDDFFSEAEAYFKTEWPVDQKVPAWEAMAPFVKGEAFLMVHANDYRAIKAALNWAGSRGYKMAVAGGKDAWMLAKELAEKKVPVIYDCVFNVAGGFFPTPYRDTEPYDTAFKAPEILRAAGVKVAFSEVLGGDGASNLRNMPYSAAHSRAFGYPEEDAIKGLTLHTAEILGVADRLGSIEAGKEATFFTCTGSILDVRAEVKSVWIAGQLMSMESRHTRLYEKYRNRPRQ